MKKILLSIVAIMAICLTANADIFKYTPESMNWKEDVAKGTKVCYFSYDSDFSFILDKAGYTADTIAMPKTEIRIYKDATFFIESVRASKQKISAIVFTCTSSRCNDLTPDKGTATTDNTNNKITWLAADANTGDVTFTAAVAQTRVTEITIYTNGDKPEVEPQPTLTDLLNESLISSKGSFTIDDKVLPEGISYVWSTSSYGMKASAYVSKTNYATESWLVSKELDATAWKDLVLSFNHTGKYFGTMTNEATLWVKEVGGEFQQVTIPTYMTGNDFNFVTASVDLSAYNGKKFQFAFKYVSTASAAATWEIKNVKVAGSNTSIGINTVNADVKAEKAGKFIENGQVVILKSGKKYNIAGALLK